MKFRNVAAAAVGGLGLAAVSNRVLASRADELEPALPGAVGRYRWRGFDVAYAEGGDPEDPDLLLVHGIHAAASNKEFDRVFEALADSYHVIAPDLPGFGLSDRPPLVYSASLYEAFLSDFARELTDDAICVASSLSSAYAVAVQRETGAFSQLALVCPVSETGTRRAWLRAVLRSPVVGSALFNALTSEASLRWFSERQSVVDPATMTDADIAYYWQTAHQPGAKFAPASFVGGFLDPDLNLADALSDVDVPVTLVWGREAGYPPVELGRELAAAADVKLVVVEGTRLLPHHERPADFLDALGLDAPTVTDG